MKKRFKIPVGELFSFFGKLDSDYETPIAIGRYLTIKNQYAEYKNVNFLVRKQGMVNTYVLENDITIKCDERHLVRSDGTFVHIKDAEVVDTIYGSKKMVEVIPDMVKDVYDFSIDSPHEYITANGVICHNTTLAKLITKSIESDVLIINASDENGVETLRVKIKNFASGVGFKPYKIVILDECLDEATLVSVMRNGDVIKLAIKDLDEKTDLVKSWNNEKREIQWRPFYLWDKGEQDVYEIELDNGEKVVCTPDHKWYVEDDNGNIIVVKASELIKYNHILSPQ